MDHRRTDVFDRGIERFRDGIDANVGDAPKAAIITTHANVR